MKKSLLCFILFTSALIGNSRNKTVLRNSYLIAGVNNSAGIFSFFNAHREGRNATGLMWKVSDVSGIISFEIQRSFDGEFFDPIGSLSYNSSHRFTYKDVSASPGFLYYRIAAHFLNGDVAYSDVQIVHIIRK